MVAFLLGAGIWRKRLRRPWNESPLNPSFSVAVWQVLRLAGLFRCKAEIGEGAPVRRANPCRHRGGALVRWGDPPSCSGARGAIRNSASADSRRLVWRQRAVSAAESILKWLGGLRQLPRGGAVRRAAAVADQLTLFGASRCVNWGFAWMNSFGSVERSPLASACAACAVSLMADSVWRGADRLFSRGGGIPLAPRTKVGVARIACCA